MVVVGGGPVGYCTALGLASHGVPVVLIEADDSVCFGSRAICISRRSLEIVERLGALDGFLDDGLPWTGGRSYYRDTEVLHFTMPQDENQKLPPMVNLAQYSIEQILLERAEAQPELIDIRWQTRVTGDRGARRWRAADARHAAKATTRSTPTGWWPPTAGAASCARRSACKLQGTSYEGRYVIVDILLDSHARPSGWPTSTRRATPARPCWCTSSPTTSGASTTSCATARTPTRPSSPRTSCRASRACSR